MYATIISFLTCGLVQPQRKTRKGISGSQSGRAVATTISVIPIAAATPDQRQTPIADVVKGGKCKPARRPVQTIFHPSSSESRLTGSAFPACSQFGQAQRGKTNTASPRLPMSTATASAVSSAEYANDASSINSMNKTGSPDNDCIVAGYADLNGFQTASTNMAMDTLDGVYRRFGHLSTRDMPEFDSASATNMPRPFDFEDGTVNGFQPASTSMSLGTLGGKYRCFGHLTLRDSPSEVPSSAVTPALSCASIQWHGISDGFKTTSTSMTLDTLDGKYRRFGHLTFRDSSTISPFSAPSPSSVSTISSEQGDSIDGFKTTTTVMTMDTLDCAYRRFGHLTLRESQIKPPYRLSAPLQNIASSDV